jgi:hypothetical protein
MQHFGSPEEWLGSKHRMCLDAFTLGKPSPRVERREARRDVGGPRLPL